MHKVDGFLSGRDGRKEILFPPLRPALVRKLADPVRSFFCAVGLNINPGLTKSVPYRYAPWIQLRSKECCVTSALY